MKPPKEEHIEVDWEKERKLNLDVGDIFRCRFHRHGSVGEDAEFEISDTNIIVHEDTQSEYLHPEHMKKPGWTGGDAERCYWHFKAIAPGKATLTVKILFRFDVESTHVVEIEVN